jgi:mycothiol synthase
VPLALREPTRAEAGTIAEILNAHSGRLFGERDLTARAVADWFEIDGVWMRLAERDGAAVGYADVAEEGGRWSIDLRALDPDGARKLLDASVARAGANALVRGYAPSTDEIAAAVYTDAGFAIVRHSFQMRIELPARPPAPSFPPGLEVRTMRRGEEPRVHAAHMDAFADHWDFHEQSYEQWRRWQRDVEGFDATLWFLALDGEEIAGLALCGPHHSGEPDFGWVSVLGVRPAWRRRGLGEALLRHGFRTMFERGFTRIGLGVDAENTTGAVRLYERAGMRAIRRNDTWELRTPEAVA